MTDAPTPVVLRHGKLTADMVPLLKAGSSVFRLDGDCAGFVSGDLFTYAGCDNVLPRRVQLYDKAGQPPKTWALSRFTYIGERDADGWIHAPEGGWKENPVPGMRVTIRCRQDSPVTGISDPFRWVHGGTNPRADIIAFRLSDQPVENSPSPALGGYEAKRSEPKDHPTPVGGLEPVAYRARIRPDGAWLRLEHEYVALRTDDPAVEVDPLYSSSTVSTLQAEIERLREALTPFAAMATAGDQRPNDDAVWAGQDGRRITYGDFRRAKRFLQALGGSHED